MECKFFNLNKINYFIYILFISKRQKVLKPINFDKQFILTKNIHSPAPPKIYPPAENIDLININFPPGITPQPPGFPIDLSTETYKKVLNC